MSVPLYVCDSCGHEVKREQVHLHYERGEQFVFHKNGLCYPAWIRENARLDAQAIAKDELWAHTSG
jgi:hypothetical protein